MKKIIMKKLFDEFLQRPRLKSVSFQLAFVMNCKNRQHLIHSENYFRKKLKIVKKPEFLESDDQDEQK